MTKQGLRGAWVWPLLAAVVCVLQACSSHPPAPIEERSSVGDRQANRNPARTRSQRQPQPPPEYYVVARGDTLHAIAFRFGLDFREVARWNNLSSMDLIRTGQRLRLKPPAFPVRAASREHEPERSPTPAGKKPVPVPPAPTKTPPRAETRTPARKAAEPVTSVLRWQWPVSGSIIQTFDQSDPARPGLDIGGSEGEAVRAAADGQVVYSGSGLIGYGELIIIKHDDRLLSAYAHNRKRLVQENQQVKAGQKIAEMGRNGSNRVMLHFEIRELGTPVNPLRYLPKR